MDATTYQDYVNILHEELVPAMGCTEPIAIAYAAAVARQTLGRPAQRMEVEASGNIIKNVKSVFVPNTGGLRGIPAAAAAGMAAGDPALELEVLSSIAVSYTHLDVYKRQPRPCATTSLRKSPTSPAPTSTATPSPPWNPA